MMGKKLKIGGKVYRYVSSFPSAVFCFEIIGIRQYQDTEQYHVKCLSCNNHPPCEMLIGLEGKELRFIQCLNNRGDDYEEERDERYWHNFGELFYISKEKAIFEKLNSCRSDHLKEIKKAEKQLKYRENNLIKLDAEIDTYNLLLNKKETP